MYLQHFGLDAAPFSITPDPRFVFLSTRHEDALAHLRYGISTGGGGGFVQLTGEVGTGKTTICRLLLENLPGEVDAALVLNPLLEPTQLLETICEELGVNTRAAWGNPKKLTDRLNKYLLKSHAEGKTVVVLIDEAQNLSAAALEQVRLLTNLETATQKLLQIVLVGQPELRQLLRRADLRQLAQRITARYHLEPLDQAETMAYVRHRLKVAGADDPLFSRAALKALFRATGGVPRLINIVADRALLAAYARQQPGVDARLVRRAAREVHGEERGNRPQAWARAVALAGLLLALTAAGFWWMGGLDSQRSTEAPVTTAQAEETQQDEALPPAESTQPLFGTDSFASAWQVLLHTRGIGDEYPAETCHWEAAGSVRCLERRGSTADLLRLDRPVLAAVGGGHAVVTMLGLERVRWETEDDGGEVTLADFEARWSGRYWDLWRMPGYVPDVLQEGDRGPGVLWVKRLAEQADPPYLGDPGDPYFGPSLKRWAEEFQHSAGLPADGLIGRETLQFLSRYGEET